MRLLLVALVVVSHGAIDGRSLARADETAAQAPSLFTSLAPDGARSEVHVELVTGSVEPAPSLLAVTSLHVDAQYVTTRGFGGYARLGAVYTNARPFDSTVGLAGTEVGGLQRLRMAWGGLTGRVGVSLPSRPEPSSSSFFGAEYVVRARRPSDHAWLSLDDAILRLALTPTYSRGPFLLRIDVGLDASLARSAELSDSSYHADVAVGLRRCAASATVEFSTFGYVDGDRPFGRVRRHAVTIGAQYQLRSVMVSARVGSPFTTGEFPDLPPGYRSVVTFGEHLALALGLSVPL